MRLRGKYFKKYLYKVKSLMYFNGQTSNTIKKSLRIIVVVLFISVLCDLFLHNIFFKTHSSCLKMFSTSETAIRYSTWTAKILNEKQSDFEKKI